MNDYRSRILYVDDEADIQQLVKIALEDLAHFHVTLASSGKEAIGLLRDQSFDLLVLDIMMPHLTGPETLDFLQKNQIDHPPVVFISAKSMKEKFQIDSESGTVEMISKPFDPLELPRTISEILERSKARKANESVG